MNRSEVLKALEQDWIVLKSESPGVIGSLEFPSLDLDLDFGHGPLRLALTENNLERFLIPVASHTKLYGNIEGHGVGVSIQSFLNSGRTCDFIDIRCLDSRLSGVFITVVFEIIRRLVDGNAPVTAVMNVLNEFRQLLRQKSSSLTDKQLLGLIGELSYLNELSAHSQDAFLGWTGPKGTIHDFTFENIAIEVKSSLKRHGKLATINGFDQLDNSNVVKLLLVYQVFEEGSPSDLTLSSILESLERKGVPESEMLAILARLGIDDPYSPSLNTKSFKLLNRTIYDVEEGFPRIIPSSFQDSILPPGIVNCSYDVDLETATRFVVDEQAIHELKSTFLS